MSNRWAVGPSFAAVALLALLGGCGDQYRAPVTPVNPVGPASQPGSYFVALSAPSASAPGVVTILDAAGDTVVAQATVGAGPFSFALNATGSAGYNLNANSSNNVTLNSYGISVGSAAGGGLQTRNVQSSTLAANANPVNILSATNASSRRDVLYLAEPYADFATRTFVGTPSVAVLSGATTPPSLQQEIPVAPNPVNFAGNGSAPRIYSISQSQTGAPTLPYNACNTPTTVAQAGEADAIDTGTNAISNRLPLGICPVYGIMSTDTQRAFFLNRGSNNITVINAQTNQLDRTATLPNATLPVGAGPVAADYYNPSSLLVTANYDSGTISILSVALDVYGNDAPSFGYTRTVKVGNGPVAVSILQDGSRAYVANQLDGTVSVVDLRSFQLVKTVPVYHPAEGTAHPSAIASVSSTPAGKVYVVSKDSPYITVIRTDTDTVSANILLQGNAVDVRASNQVAGGPTNASPLNTLVTSRAAGQGVPCGIGGGVNGAPVTNADISPFCIYP